MNKTIIQGEVTDIINPKAFIYKITTESLTGTMIYKVNSTKKLRKGDVVIVVGELIHNEIYLGINEENGLIRDSRELVLEADVVEIKGFGTHVGGMDCQEDLDNAFETHINW